MNKRILTGAFAILIAVSPMTTHAESFQIKGKSMLPTYKEGDVVDINHTKEYKDGDIVIAELKNGKKVIKRLQGDMLEGDNKKGSINIPLTEVKEIIGKPTEYTGETNSFEELLAVGIKDIQIGDAHGGALTESGELYMWGQNSYGALGIGDTTNRLSPVKVMSDIDSFSLGGSSSGAIDSMGNLYTWGYNDVGQLANETTTNRLTPKKILSDIKSVHMGGQTNGAITKEGDLYAWGASVYGQLGSGLSGTNATSHKPLLVMSDVRTADFGTHSLAVTNKDELFVWGYNDKGQIGDGTLVNKSKPVKILDGVGTASAGFKHTMAITTNGEVFGWGYNKECQVGFRASVFTDVLTPKQLDIPKTKSISAGYNTTVAITENGDLYTWGLNSNGLLATGDTNVSLMHYDPKKISEGMDEVVSSQLGAIAINKLGEIQVWGDGSGGILGFGGAYRLFAPLTFDMSKLHTTYSLTRQITGVIYLPDSAPILPNYRLLGTKESGEILTRTLNGYDTLLTVIRYTPPTTIGNLNIN